MHDVGLSDSREEGKDCVKMIHLFDMSLTRLVWIVANLKWMAVRSNYSLSNIHLRFYLAYKYVDAMFNFMRYRHLIKSHPIT